MTTPNSSNPQAIALDVSRKALSIARIIDRLPAGNYTIHLKRPENPSERWTVEIHQPVTVVQKREVFDKTLEERKE